MQNSASILRSSPSSFTNIARVLPLARIAVAAAGFLTATAFVVAIPAQAGADTAPTNHWLTDRVLDMAHAGGESEAPTNTMYAFKRAVKLGADMLELDIESTKDNQIVVYHSATLGGTTPSNANISTLTLKQVQKLDDAYYFTTDASAKLKNPAKKYPFRGIATGKKKPPKGYQASDFRISTLAQVFRQFPHTPINIEIKGLADDNLASFEHNADLLAAFLNQSKRTDVIVVSFNDDALKYFHTLAPQIGLAPGMSALQAYYFNHTLPIDGTVALQVPVYYNGLLVVTPDLVAQAHADGYAVDVWFDPGWGNDDRATYEMVLDAGVDGVMAGKPTLLEQIFKERGTPHP